MSAKTSQELFYHVWTTAWGPIGAVSGPGGIRRLVLPHYQRNDLAELLAWEHPLAVADEGHFARLMQLTRDYFNAAVVDFAEVKCLLPAEKTFAGRVLRACRGIPYAQTRSYLELAKMVSQPDAARAVAGTMSRNPLPLIVPCHRVMYADGRAGGFSAPGGIELKQRMLDLERTVAGRAP